MTTSDASRLRRIALRTALIYVALAALWILASDRVLAWFVQDPRLLSGLSIAKGWLFVVVTGTLLFFSLRRQLQHIAAEVDARTRSSEELDGQRRRLDSIIEGTDVGTWEWNVQTGEVVFNERWAGMLGYRLEELAPVDIHTWQRLVHPDDLKESGRLIQLHFSGEIAHYEIECRVRHKRGDWIWVHDRGRLMTRTAEGKPLMMYGTHTDITARKLAEIALRETEERFREIAENINEVFWIIDGASPGGRAVYVSPAYEQVWGRSREALLRGEYSWIDTVHPEDRRRITAAIAERFMGGRFDETYRIIRPGGEVRWINDRAYPVRDETGHVYRIVGTAQDITDQRRLEEQLRQAQKMQAIGTLAGGIAHDFNNLLGAIMGFAELTRLQLQDRPQERENIEDILRAGRRAISLVRQILAFSRRTAGERVLMQLRPVVDEAVQLLRATLPTTIEISTDVRRDVPTVVADPSQIHQIVMNLGTNAWHAMKDRSGRLEVEVSRWAYTLEDVQRDPRLHAGVFARLSIADTGTGIAPEILERMFEPFFTTKPPGEGTGLGLAVVHGIVRDHEGFITVESTLGNGSVFRVHLPAALVDSPATLEDTASLPRGRGERVLFVDDEVALVRLGVGMLQELGYAADGAEGAHQALERVRASPDAFALVISDQTMPVLTGLALARHIHAIQPRLPVILVTGYAGEIAAETLADAGVNELLLKPLSLGSLAQSAAKVLGARPFHDGQNHPVDRR